MRATPAVFEDHRAYLTGLAYRMLGSLADAEDAVQDSYLRWRAADRDVAEPRAYLAKAVTRICLDTLKSARARHETYVGPWLPEPVIEGLDASAVSAADIHIDAPVALMLALERLSPLERAVFLLHDVLDMAFCEVAAALDRSEATCRQLASRARRNVRAEDRHQHVADEDARRIASAFFNASQTGNTARLRDLLADSAVFHSDGGGRNFSARRLVFGADRVARLLVGLARKARRAGFDASWHQSVRINGLPGYVSVGAGGILQTTALQVEREGVTAVYVVRNPDKLQGVAAWAPANLLD